MGGWLIREEWWGLSAIALLDSYKAEAWDCGRWFLKCDGEIVRAGKEEDFRTAMSQAETALLSTVN